jgi:hypothetical protein
MANRRAQSRRRARTLRSFACCQCRLAPQPQRVPECARKAALGHPVRSGFGTGARNVQSAIVTANHWLSALYRLHHARHVRESAWQFAPAHALGMRPGIGSAASLRRPTRRCHPLCNKEVTCGTPSLRHPAPPSPCQRVTWRLCFGTTSRAIRGRVREVMASELFTIYTRLAFGVTMILAVACVLLEQFGGAL